MEIWRILIQIIQIFNNCGWFSLLWQCKYKKFKLLCHHQSCHLSLILIILYAKSFNFNNDILLSRAFQLSSNIKSRINFLLNTQTLCKTALNGLWGLGTVKANMILCHNIILSIIKIEWDRQDLHLNFFRQSRENYLMSSI